MLTKKSVLGTLALAACGLALCATLFSSAGPPLAFVGKAGWPSDGSEIVIETQAAKGKWSVCKPDPAWLIWDNSGTNDGFITTLKGWLKVPILHEQPGLIAIGKSLGFTAIRVSASTTCKSSPKAIFSHCGGPGTDNSCHMMLFNYATKELVKDGTYDNLAITQRGITKAHPFDPTHAPVPFKDLDGKSAVKAFPDIRCFESTSVHALRMVKQAYDDAGLDFAPLWKKVKETSAKSFSFQHLIIDPELTKLYAKLVSAAGLECRTRPEYQLGYNGVYGRMVYQDYMGTIDLVHDLEILRAAIGLEKLSLWGASYGTEVGASYATVYPDRVLRLILDGNVAVSNDIYAAAELWSLSYEQVWNGLAAACDSDYFIEGDIINNNNAFHTTTGAQKEHVASQLCAAMPYATEKVYALLAKNNDQFVNIFALFQAAFEGGSGAIMDKGLYPAAPMLMACLQSLYKQGNFKGDGCCFTIKEPGPDQIFTDAILDTSNPAPLSLDKSTVQAVALVRAVDMADRLNAEDVSRLWSELRLKHPLGFLRAVNIFAVATSPNLPRPVPSYGSSLATLTPLVIGELHDPATTYTAAQMMKQFFPQGKLMTWQGYKHCLPSIGTLRLPNLYNETGLNTGWGAHDCMDRLTLYLKTDELPPDGYTCPINGPAAGALKWQHAIDAVGRGICLHLKD